MVVQLGSFIVTSWLMGTLSIDSIAELFSLKRLRSFETFPFYRSLAQLFVSMVHRAETLSTPATIEKLLSSSQLSPDKLLVRVRLLKSYCWRMLSVPFISRILPAEMLC